MSLVVSRSANTSLRHSALRMTLFTTLALQKSKSNTSCASCVNMLQSVRTPDSSSLGTRDVFFNRKVCVCVCVCVCVSLSVCMT